MAAFWQGSLPPQVRQAICQSISLSTQLKLSPTQLKFESVTLKSLRFPRKVLLLDSWSADHSANQLIAWALSADCPSSLSWFFYNIELVSTVIKSYSILHIKSFGENFSIIRPSLDKVVLFSRPFNSRNSDKFSQLNLSQLIFSQLKIVPQLKSSQPNLSQPKSI